MSARVHVINPNSSRSVTDGIARAVAPFARPGTVDFLCATLDDAPPGIVTQGDADVAAPMVARYVAKHAADAAGFIIACYSDPGLFACREITTKPVIGIGEASLHSASASTSRVGVIAVSTKGIARHWRMYRLLGLAERICGERAIDLSVADSGNESLALDRLIEVGKQLRDEDRAEAIVLGCAGMADLRAKVEAAVGIPVLDPCGSAAAQMVATFS